MTGLACLPNHFRLSCSVPPNVLFVLLLFSLYSSCSLSFPPAARFLILLLFCFSFFCYLFLPTAVLSPPLPSFDTCSLFCSVFPSSSFQPSSFVIIFIPFIYSKDANVQVFSILSYFFLLLFPFFHLPFSLFTLKSLSLKPQLILS